VPQKLFAIVNRHDNGYQFWKVDGTYHESYGLAKGSVSVSQTPRSARSINIGTLGSPKRQAMSTPTKTGKAAAWDVDDPDDTPLRVLQRVRALTRSRDTKTQTARGQGEDPFADSPEPLSKRRNTGTSSVPSTTPTRQPQSRRSSTNGSTRSLLHITEVCMLAYHVRGPALKLLYGNAAFTIESGEGLESKYSKLLEQLNTRRMTIFDAEKGNSIKAEASVEQVKPLTAENGAKASGGEGTSCPQVVTETSSSHVPATPMNLGSATILTTPMSRGPLQSSLPASTSISSSLSQAVNVNPAAPPNGQTQDTTAIAPSQPTILTKEAAVKKELLGLLRDMYVKYPGAQDDSQVEAMALLLKASLLAGEQERVRELKTEMKVYLISHHG
jgi:hypothetical protein